MKETELKHNSYNQFFNRIIEAINSARIKAFRSLNKHQITLNFEIGKLIVENQEKHGWGKSIVETLSKDINKQIDGISGYSPRIYGVCASFISNTNMRMNFSSTLW